MNMGLIQFWFQNGVVLTVYTFIALQENYKIVSILQEKAPQVHLKRFMISNNIHNN